LDKKFERYSHSVEVNEQKRLLAIYRPNEKGEKALFASVDLPVKSFNEDAEGYREFARLLGENLLIDSPVARKLLGLGNGGNNKEKEE